MARGDVEKLYTTDPLMVLATSRLAVKVQRGNEEPFWLPFSLIVEPYMDDIVDAKGTEMEMTIPEWLAREKGLF